MWSTIGQNVNMRNYCLGNASILPFTETPWMQARSPIIAPPAYQLSFTNSSPWLWITGEIWVCLESDEWPHWGCGWETYICLASLRPWKRVRGMGDFLLFFSLGFHVQISVSHLWCIVRSALTTVTCGVTTELLTGIPVNCRSRSIGIQQWWCVLMGTFFLVFILFIVDIN